MTRARLAAATSAALVLALAGFTPFRAEDPDVREGNERVAAGRPAEALPRYDAAERTAGPRAEIDYDRGVALLRLGRSTEARDALRRALARSGGAGELTSRAQQNLATALEASGDREGAIAAFGEALRADPGNEDARFGLEVLLRRREAAARRRAPAPEAPAAQAQGARGVPGGEARAGDGERRPSPQPRPAAPRPGAAEEPEDAHGARGPGEPDPARLSQDDAARILDAFRARERAMPLPGAGRHTRRRGDAERDW